MKLGQKITFSLLLIVFSATMASLVNINHTKSATSMKTSISQGIIDNSLTSINIKALPEKRVNKIGGNLANYSRLQIKNIPSGSVLLENFFTTGPLGLKDGVNISTLSSGTYDVFLKGHSHLTKKLTALSITSENTEIDFSNSGTQYLLAGDVNGLILGDDVVNAIDLSILINDLDTFDLRTDLNRDNTVNALDLSILITNLDRHGDV